jgi:hypothetical protein
MNLQVYAQVTDRFECIGDSLTGPCPIHGDPTQLRVSISKHCWKWCSDAYTAKYVPIGYRTPSPEELGIRRIAQDLKVPTEEAIAIAAPAMAALIDGPCWLVPVPASTGSLIANLALAHAVADLVPGGRVKCAVGRAHAVESCSHRRLRGLPGLTVHQHAIIRTADPMQPWPVYFVDNVITTGTTIAACRRALGWGTGLAYADASTFHNTRRLRSEIPSLRGHRLLSAAW